MLLIIIESYDIIVSIIVGVVMPMARIAVNIVIITVVLIIDRIVS